MSVARLATAADLDAVAEMAGNRAMLARDLDDPGAVFLVAEWGGAPIGYLIARTSVDRNATIDAFGVDTPALWPSVGQSLLREAMAQLKERRMTQIVVTTGNAALLASEKFVPSGDGWRRAL